MRIIRLAFAGLCFFASLTASAQDKEVAAKELLIQFDQTVGTAKTKLANDFFAHYINEEIADSVIRFKPTTHPDTLRQQVYYWAAEFFYDQQQYSTAEEYGLKALPFCQSASSRDLEGDCLNLLSVIYIRLTDYEKAAKYAKLCYEIDKEEGNPDKISSSLNTLAAIYMSARQPKEAEKYVLKGVEYSLKANNLPRRAVLYGMASEVYHALGDEQKSYDYARLAYETEQKVGQTPKIPIRQAQMASALIGLKRYDEAKSLLQEVIPAFRANGNRQSLGISCNQMGEILLDEEQNDSAARYFDEALQIFILHKDLYNESRSRKGLYIALRESNPQLAMQHLERRSALKDSLYDSETGMLLSKYAADYDNEQLQLENEFERAAHRRSILIAALVVLLVAVGIWLFMLRKNRKQQRHLRELTAMLERLEKREKFEKFEKPEKTEEASTDIETPMPDDTPSDTPDDTADDTPDPLTENTDEYFLLQTASAIHKGMKEGDLSVESIADTLCMSAATFRRRIVQTTGEKPATYILAVRMQKAHQMLEDEAKIPISEIARMCGYDEISTFSRAFKRVYGIPPSAKQTSL